MDFKTLNRISKKSLVSDFRLKIKIICVCLLIPTVVIELYNLFFMDNELCFPALEFGIALWAFICAVYLFFMVFSAFLKKISLKSEVAFLPIRRKVILLISIFLFMAVIFTTLFMWELKNRQDWKQGVTDVENLLFQMKQEEN